MRALLAIVAAGCTEGSLHVPGEPVDCDPLGGQVDGTFTGVAAETTQFGAVQATFAAPDLVTLSDGTLMLVIAIAAVPREMTLVFPGRPVFATTGKLIMDETAACRAGRFDATFQFHGEISGWFAVPTTP